MKIGDSNQIPIGELSEHDIIDREWVVDAAQDALALFAAVSSHDHVIEAYLDRYQPGIFALFLFEVEPTPEKPDSAVWVVIGDLPPAILDTASNPNGGVALQSYVGAMREWVKAVTDGEPIGDLIPVYYKKSTTRITPTKEYADMLKSRLDFFEAEILPLYAD